MARPLRIEFSNALYHVTSRGDRREPIYEDDEDRQRFVSILTEVIAQMNWLCHAYCLMTNHYHLIIETPDGNLSKGMRQLNGVFTQSSNRRHHRSGHLFQGRYKAILVDKNSYLLELTRYVVLNPVRAGLVLQAQDWPWSSYRAMMGLDDLLEGLQTDALLALFSKNRASARRQYARFVAEGIDAASPWEQLKGQIYLGNEQFVKHMQGKIKNQSVDVNIPKAQRCPPAPTLERIAQRYTERNRAIIEAYATGRYSYHEIGAFFDLHFTTVGKIVRQARK
ncbi:MAG: transposase [Gammaproteobacteria bacterium]|nr:transposase [Gammaproteobacteria bacterium]